MTRLFLFVTIGLLCFQAPAALSHTPLLYSEVVSFIRDVSDPDVIPVKYDGEAVKVGLTLSLIDISDVDTDKNQVEVIAWPAMSWNNPALSWTPSSKNNVTGVAISSRYLWTPDFFVYNSVQKPEVSSPELAHVSYDGTILYVPALRLRFLCDLESVDKSSGVTCNFIMGSWTTDGFLLDLPEPKIELSDYSQAAKYELISATAEREVKHYSCCPEPYIDAKFSITFKEREAGRKGFFFLFD